eukprot:TRINITY_DN6747_c0_g1_i3.p3 TRINITY_DN6747_c0_g1~~TRINITY_DN6747_c0_g1_i3.p3  ORF type:complete len:173 (-),score=11.60 TRINITY_DN6747_c0_g1_i3:512-1030(-)
MCQKYLGFLKEGKNYFGGLLEFFDWALNQLASCKVVFLSSLRFKIMTVCVKYKLTFERSLYLYFENGSSMNNAGNLDLYQLYQLQQQNKELASDGMSARVQQEMQGIQQNQVVSGREDVQNEDKMGFKQHEGGEITHVNNTAQIQDVHKRLSDANNTLLNTSENQPVNIQYN